jgi:serine/threonine protein phosphatase PrpC
VERAVTDGYSTAGGLGIGLGTVNRLMDDLEFFSNSQAGLRVVCQRWLRPRPSAFGAARLAFGAATRPCRLGPENGDAFIIRQWESYALAGVIDGLGHGQFAQRAAQTARQYIEQHFDQPLPALFRGAERACRATRGVVLALARFDLARRNVQVASVGNVEVRLLGGPTRLNLLARRGIIGLNAPSPAPTEHPWASSSLLVMHSDGLHTHWEWEQFRGAAQDSPTVLAHQLLRALGKMEDDATVIVVSNASP